MKARGSVCVVDLHASGAAVNVHRFVVHDSYVRVSRGRSRAFSGQHGPHHRLEVEQVCVYEQVVSDRNSYKSVKQSNDVVISKQR